MIVGRGTFMTLFGLTIFYCWRHPILFSITPTAIILTQFLNEFIIIISNSKTFEMADEVSIPLPQVLAPNDPTPADPNPKFANIQEAPSFTDSQSSDSDDDVD